MIALVVIAAVSGAVFYLAGLYDGRALERRRAEGQVLAARRQAYEAGKQDGSDELANEYLAAAARARDPFDAWPAQRIQARRPS
jgi:hypothetical protein